MATFIKFFLKYYSEIQFRIFPNNEFTTIKKKTHIICIPSVNVIARLKSIQLLKQRWWHNKREYLGIRAQNAVC